MELLLQLTMYTFCTVSQIQHTSLSSSVLVVSPSWTKLLVPCIISSLFVFHYVLGFFYQRNFYHRNESWPSSSAINCPSFQNKATNGLLLDITLCSPFVFLSHRKYSWSSASVGFSMSAYCRLNPHHFATDDSSYFTWFCRRFLLVELFFSTVQGEELLQSKRLDAVCWV
ncbi:hypothetical protein AMECASPLE_023579 [Ameca splendens]|uniref:Uncharacterized protein n=1 Tax=Ameca splendens TaxID=208324 RepID=A0ABV0Y4Q0_9TELE